jgi:hypothetical protein
MRIFKNILVFEIIIAVIILTTVLYFSINKSISKLNFTKYEANKKGISFLRKAIVLYYVDTKGSYPTENVAAELAPKYISEIPFLYVGNKKTNKIIISDSENVSETGWVYNPFEEKTSDGREKGEIWIKYPYKDLNKL